MLIQNWFYSVIVNRCFYFINLLKYSWLPVQTMKTIVLDHFFLSKIQFWILILCKALIPLIIDMINFTMQVRWALWSYSLWMLHYSSLCKGLIMWSLNINLGSWDFWYHRASFVLVMKKFTNTSQVSRTIQKPTFRPSVLFTVLEYVNMVYLYVALFSFYVHIMCSLVDRERVALNKCILQYVYYVWTLFCVSFSENVYKLLKKISVCYFHRPKEL